MKEKVYVLEYLANEQKLLSSILKETRMDVVCQISSLDLVDVEVQVAQTRKDFDKRIVFYNAQLLVNQESYRKAYDELHKAISIILCGFPLHKGKTILDSAEQSFDLFHPLQRIILVDLTLIGEMNAEEITKASLAEKIGYLLYHYEKAEKQDIIKVIKKESEVGIVAEQIGRISKEEKEAIRQMRARLFENDGYLMEQDMIRQLMATGKADGISEEQAKAYLTLINEGKTEGIAEGRFEGIAEGEVKAKRNALLALTKKMPLEKAIELLDMSDEEAQCLLSINNKSKKEKFFHT